jgi:hypothetical protein
MNWAIQGTSSKFTLRRTDLRSARRSILNFAADGLSGGASWLVWSSAVDIIDS